MFKFNAGTFSDLANTPLGREIWKYLNADELFIRLETSTYLRRPALEGAQPQLLKKFGKGIKLFRIKQMTGRMVRQIMEHHGYSLDQTGVRIRVGELYTTAARYRKNA